MGAFPETWPSVETVASSFTELGYCPSGALPQYPRLPQYLGLCAGLVRGTWLAASKPLMKQRFRVDYGNSICALVPLTKVVGLTGITPLRS